jgi:ribosomal protein S18 acetylase RimI-like enzyme
MMSTNRQQTMSRSIEYRTIRQEEALQAAEVELVSFPPHEACKKEHMVERVRAVPDLFMAAVDSKAEKVVGILTGIATNEAVFRDKFFTDVTTHQPAGSNIMILSLAVLPEYRGLGVASSLMKQYVDREQKKGRKALILTCADEKVGMYERMGFQDLGMSGSSWGGEAWHEMKYVLNR